mmetsp:Transcript_1164/g.1439  ORF Transcript_1164/g.1439 Transcript_1164/m.1439 type:complete len:81 (-) Transcript_1164:66-308(-)
MSHRACQGYNENFQLFWQQTKDSNNSTFEKNGLYFLVIYTIVVERYIRKKRTNRFGYGLLLSVSFKNVKVWTTPNRTKKK